MPLPRHPAPAFPRDCVICSPSIGGVVLTSYDLSGRVRYELHCAEQDITPGMAERLLAATRALSPTLSIIR